jgi:hypothetical protein
MGRERKKRRTMKIRQAQKRRAKLARLRKKYQAAVMDSDKERILEKVFKIAPYLSKEEFLKPIKEKKEMEKEKKAD